MNLRTLPLDRLNPAPYNPRVRLKPGMPEYRRLERSLDEFGLVQPVVWNRRTGHVVGGHQRLEILKDRGETEVQAVVVDLPLEREKALNVALNNTQIAGDWDPDRLTDLLAELQTLPDLDATLTGFDEQDLKDLLLAPTPDLPDDPELSNDNPTVRVTIEVPAEAWETVRPDLDPLVAQHNLTLHVKMPD